LVRKEKGHLMLIGWPPLKGNMRITVLLSLMTYSVAVSVCPTKDEMEAAGGFPRAKQVASEAAFVEWSDLWPQVDWAECFERTTLVVRQEGREMREVTLDDVEARNMTVTLEPCLETRFAVKTTLAGNGDDDEGVEVTSLESERGFQTFMPPRVRDLDDVGGLYGKLSRGVQTWPGGPVDLSKASVQISFRMVADDPVCRRVTGAELRFRRKSNDTEIVWTVAASTAMAFRQLDETVEGLDDLCAAYEFELELAGTAGAGGALVPLEDVQAPSKQELADAYDSGYRPDLGQGPLVRIGQQMEDVVTVEWEAQSCVNAYRIVVSDGHRGQGVVVGELEVAAEFDKSVLTADIGNLTHCSAYTVELRSLLKSVGGRAFKSSPAIAKGHTVWDPNEAEDIDLQSLTVRSGRTSATLSWLRDEWICLGPLEAAVCEAANASVCLAPVTASSIGGRTVATFRGLTPCRSYEVCAWVRPE